MSNPGVAPWHVGCILVWVNQIHFKHGRKDGRLRVLKETFWVHALSWATAM